MKNPPKYLEPLLREYKEHGGPRVLSRLLAAYHGTFVAVSRRYAKHSKTNLHGEDDLYSVAATALHFAVLAYEFRCATCPGAARPAFLSLSGLRLHAKAVHRLLGAEPEKSLTDFVYWRVGNAVQKVVNKERAQRRGADRLDSREEPGEEAHQDPMLRVGYDPSRDMEDTLDKLRLIAAAQDGLSPRDQRILKGLLLEEDGGDLYRDVSDRFRLTPGSAKMAVSRTRGRVRSGDLLPDLV